MNRSQWRDIYHVVIQQKRSLGIFFLIACIYFCSRYYPRFRFGDVAFGYDTGIYRRIIVDFVSGGEQPAFFFSWFSRLFGLLGLTPDQILYEVYIGIACLFFFAFFLLIKKQYNRGTACIAAVLLMTSVVQFDFFTAYYYRQLIALTLICIALLCVKKKQFLWAGIPLFLLVSIHPLSAIPIFVSLAIYACFERDCMFRMLTVLFGSGAIAMLFNWEEFYRYIEIFLLYQGQLAQVSGAVADELSGQFIDSKTYFQQSIFYLPFILFAFFKEREKHLLWFILLVVHIACIAAQVLLYKRFFIVIDMIGIVLSAAVLWQYVSSQEHLYRRFFALVYLCLLSFFFITHVAEYKPIFAPEELQNIREVSALIPEAQSILVYSSHYAPWVLGFMGQHTIIAPGLFDANQWNEEEWQAFWFTSDPERRRALLNEYGKDDIYIYLGWGHVTDGARLFRGDERFVELHPTLWRYHSGQEE